VHRRATILGDIPGDWDTCALGDVTLTAQYGLSIRGQPSGPYPILRMNCQVDGEVSLHDLQYVDVDQRTLRAFALKRGDILFNRTNSYELVGRSAIFDHDVQAVFASYLVRLSVDRSRVDPYFLNFLINWDVAQAELKKLASRGVSQANISASKLKEFSIHLPSIPEQHAIATVLRKVREHIAKERELEHRSRLLHAAALKELFTRGVRGESQKETEIGLMPQSWKPRRVRDLCDIWSGGTPRKSIPEYWQGTIPWVSGKDLKSPTLRDAIDHLSPAGVQAGSRLAPEGAVLVLVRGMGLAKDLPVAVITRPMAFNQDVKALVSRGEYSGRFLRSAIYVGKERLLGQIVASAHGTMTLNLNDVETFQVACPPTGEEANQIVRIVDALERQVCLHQGKACVLEELFSSLLDKLMTGAVRVHDLDIARLQAAP
jgi:type I restriction enzyme S subunit